MRITTLLRAGVSLVLSAGLGACGGSGGSAPQAPSAVATPAPRALAAGTTLSVLSGEDGAPVEGARVVVGTREYVSDGAGQLALAENAPYGTFLDIVASGFLSRQTSVPSTGRSRFVLWPKETASGMTEAFTAQLVYTYGWSEEPEHGTSPMERIPESTNQVFVWISEEIIQDSDAGRAHEEAVADMNAALEGRASYVLTPTRPASGVVFEARLAQPGDEGCEGRTLGYFRARSSSTGEITGGEIVYCAIDVAGSSTVAHELGHSVGLQHTYGSNELMNRYRTRSRQTTFSEREGLAIRLIFERPAGNRFPDTDRGVTAAAGGVHTIYCD